MPRPKTHFRRNPGPALCGAKDHIFRSLLTSDELACTTCKRCLAAANRLHTPAPKTRRPAPFIFRPRNRGDIQVIYLPALSDKERSQYRFSSATPNAVFAVCLNKYGQRDKITRELFFTISRQMGVSSYMTAPDGGEIGYAPDTYNRLAVALSAAMHPVP